MTSAAADIARFAVRMDGNGAIGAQHGFDNLTFTYPDNALPDLSLSVRPGEAVVPQGGFADVPITVTRLNGSAGAFTLAASGLPQGVTAQFVNSTLRLRAAADAPRALDVARDITITATPSSGDVAPMPRSTRLPVRVSSDFELVGSGTASFAPCAERRAGAARGARPRVQRHRHPDGQRPPGGRHRDSRTSGDPAGWRLPRRRQDPPERGQTVRRGAVHRRGGREGGDLSASSPRRRPLRCARPRAG